MSVFGSCSANVPSCPSSVQILAPDTCSASALSGCQLRLGITDGGACTGATPYTLIKNCGQCVNGVQTCEKETCDITSCIGGCSPFGCSGGVTSMTNCTPAGTREQACAISGPGASSGGNCSPQFRVTPVNAQVNKGATASFSAVFNPDNGCTAADQNVSADANWSSGAPSVAASLGGGRFSAVSRGSAPVTATYGSYSASAALDVLDTVSDFDLSVVPATTSANIGETVYFAAGFRPVGSFNGSVSLSVSGAPATMDVSVSPGVINSGQTATVIVKVNSGTNPGLINLSIRGVNGGLSHTALAQVLVKPVPDFALNIFPASTSIARGGTANYTVRMDIINGFSEPVRLSFRNFPAGAVMFAASPLLPGNNRLDITDTGSMSVASHKFTAVATASSSAHEQDLTLVVTGATHKGCNLNACADIPGGGANECVNNADCTRPTLIVDLTPTPAAGTGYLDTGLTATVGGSATGTVNYNFWWNCSSATTDLGTATASCGALPVGAAGACNENASGAKCDGIPGDSKIIMHRYVSSGSYNPKVIVERGTAANAQDTSPVTVSPNSVYSYISCSANTCVSATSSFPRSNDRRCNNPGIACVESHLECAGLACVVADGAGADRCGIDADCRPAMHGECDTAQQVCINKSGAGLSTCGNDPDCKPSCTDPSACPTHLECQNSTCVIVDGAGKNDCGIIGESCTLSHAECVNGACSLVSGAGANRCVSTPVDSCAPVTHSECDAAQKACVMKAGVGASVCKKSGSCCSGKDCDVFHIECQNSSCVVVGGAGADSPGCAAPGNSCTPSHLECVSSACEFVAGTGSNRCRNDADCKPQLHGECDDVLKVCINKTGALPGSKTGCSNDAVCSGGDPTHLECQNNACVIVGRAGANQAGCTAVGQACSSPPSTHRACQSGVCTTVPGLGSDTCAAVGAACEVRPHNECINNACTSVDSYGYSRCGNNADCVSPGYGACDASTKTCVNRTGTPPGSAVICSKDSTCSGSNPTHLECQNNSCVIVSGAGASRCSVVGAYCPDMHNECSFRACKAVVGKGPDRCTSASDCTPCQGVCDYVQKACVNNAMCTGGPACSDDATCGGGPPPSGPPPVSTSHLECQNSTCVIVGGDGANQCLAVGSACSGYHSECVNNTCTSVRGTGANRCGKDEDCTPSRGICDVAANVCINTETTSGGTTCSDDTDCGGTVPWHLECQNQTCVIVGGTASSTCLGVGAFCNSSLSCQITASPVTISAGQKSTLAWSCTGGVKNISCTVKEGATTKKTGGGAGQVDVTPTKTTTYDLNCASGPQSSAASVQVRYFQVIEVPPKV